MGTFSCGMLAGLSWQLQELVYTIPFNSVFRSSDQMCGKKGLPLRVVHINVVQPLL